MTRLIALPMLLFCAFMVGFTADCWHNLREEARKPIMNWGWRLMGHCFLVVFSVIAVGAFVAALGFAFKVIP